MDDDEFGKRLRTLDRRNEAFINRLEVLDRGDTALLHRLERLRSRLDPTPDTGRRADRGSSWASRSAGGCRDSGPMTTAAGC